MKDRLHPTGELENAVEAYKDAVSEIFHDRGLPGMSILLLENADNLPILEADVDDDDGQIEVPDGLQQVFDDIFVDTPVYLSDLGFTFCSVQINFEAERIDDSGDDGRIFIGKSLAVNSLIRFDIDNRLFSYQVFPQDHDFTLNNNRDFVEEKPINAEILRSLTSLVLNTDKRTNSYIGIYKPESFGTERQL